MEPRQLDGELEGDYIRRRASFFLRVSAASTAALAIVCAAGFLWRRMEGEWPVLVLGIPFMMLAAASFLALVGAWAELVRSLSHPRLHKRPATDRVLYIGAQLVVVAFAGWALHQAWKGYVTGAVVLRRSSVTWSSDPLMYVVVELGWIACGAVLLFGAAKHVRMMLREGHLGTARPPGDAGGP